MDLAAFFLGQHQDGFDVKVVLRTGSVGAVDDIIHKGANGDEEAEESRVRRVSCLEVGLSLR